MASNLDKYKDDLDKLIKEGDSLYNAIQFECHPVEFRNSLVELEWTKKKIEQFLKALPSFHDSYQDWYSEAQFIIKFILPDRLDDFTKLYNRPKGQRDLSYSTYVIEDYLDSLITRDEHRKILVDTSSAIPKFRQQLNILKSVQKRFESTLFDIKQLVQADLFDSELDAARELNSKGFIRAAGAIAGVVLEKHLSDVCSTHSVSIRKKKPTISDFYEALKKAGVIETPMWRKIQHLGDLRNLCDHKGPEPKKEEVEELINGVDSIIKNLF